MKSIWIILFIPLFASSRVFAFGLEVLSELQKDQAYNLMRKGLSEEQAILYIATHSLNEIHAVIRSGKVLQASVGETCAPEQEDRRIRVIKELLSKGWTVSDASLFGPISDEQLKKVYELKEKKWKASDIKKAIELSNEQFKNVAVLSEAGFDRLRSLEIATLTEDQVKAAIRFRKLNWMQEEAQLGAKKLKIPEQVEIAVLMFQEGLPAQDIVNLVSYLKEEEAYTVLSIYNEQDGNKNISNALEEALGKKKPYRKLK